MAREIIRKQSYSVSKQNFSVSRTKKVCAFCKSSSEPIYTDSVTLMKYLSDRGRIVSKLRSGVCSKHQRGVAREIKRARHLALLPFVVKV